MASSPPLLLLQFSFVEDIVLGTEGLREGGVVDYGAWVKDKPFDLGDVPLRLGGIKTYDTGDDEAIIEASLLWGSNIKV